MQISKRFVSGDGIERIEVLKKLLSSTDYLAIKFSEGLIPQSEYETTKNQRIAWRSEINDIEKADSESIRQKEV